MKKLYNILKILPEWAFLAIYLSSILLYSILIGLQGLDMTDEGWASTGFQQIYNDASTISGLFTIYDTLLVGGLFHILFPSLGMIAFRIASALCLTVVAYIVYLLLKDVINRWYIFLGVALVILNIRTIRVLHYDYVSALLALLIALCLYKACTQGKAYKMLIAGILVGISFFFRVPNVCLCGMIVVLIPLYIYNQSIKQVLVFFSYALLGVIIGVAINIGVIFLLGHQETFVDMLNITFSYLTQTDSTHNSSSLLTKLIYDIREVTLHAAIFLAIPIIDLFLQRKVAHNWVLACLRILLIGLFVWTFGGPWKNIISICAFCYIALAYNLFSHPNDQAKTYLSLLAFLIMVLQPLGSDGALYNSTNAIYLSLPLAIGVIFGPELYSRDNVYIVLYQKYSRIFIGYTIIILICSISTGAMRDPGLRIFKTERPTQTIAQTTFTTAQKAATIDSLFVHMRPYIQEDAYLLAYPSIPAINYMANLRPYLTQPWVGIMDYNTYCIAFDNSQRTKPLPIIVLSKSRSEDWFEKNESWADIADCWDWHPSIEKKNKYLAQFIRHNNYDIAWEDDYFQLLIPPQSGPLHE